MNGCALRFFTVRWAAVSTAAPVLVGRGDANTDDTTSIDDLAPDAPAQAGYFSGDGCQQPAFSMDADAPDGSTLTDITFDYQVWRPSLG